MATASQAADVISFPHPDRIRYDSHCLIIEGKDTFIYSGAFHYFRCPKDLWRDRFQKIKDAGFNTVESYVPWNYHEREVPTSPDDFSKLDLHELDEWLTLAREFGFHIIVRPGPYICAEWSGGGFPQWLVALKKPDQPLRTEMWLQTDDPEYLAWSNHWYTAVCRVVAKHQITRLAPGRPGVILFQIENEYERLRLPADVKRVQVESLATSARAGGIEVPVVTCWTREGRKGTQPGPLHGVFDFINSYPRWDIQSKLRDFTLRQQREQPYAPTMSMELQGGWYSAIGGALSEQQDGVEPAQTQNLSLYTIQLGFSGINFYMLCGGTNFDDWASREATTTYDFAAPIREHGGVGEKYQRVASIGRMLQEHGSRLVRSELTQIQVEVSDPAVQIAQRLAQDGSRYIFVRTEDRSHPHAGTARVTAVSGEVLEFPFELERFGSRVLYLSPGTNGPSAGEQHSDAPDHTCRGTHAR